MTFVKFVSLPLLSGELELGSSVSLLWCFITKDSLHIAVLHKGSEAVMCSHGAYCVSLLTMFFFFPGISGVTLI